ELLAEMVVVEPRIGGAGQAQDAVSHAPGQTARAGPPATGVSQRRCACLPIASFEAFDMARRNREQLRGAGTRQVSVHAISNHGHSLQFLRTQRECLHRGDIFTLLLRGDRIMELRHLPGVQLVACRLWRYASPHVAKKANIDESSENDRVRGPAV